MTFRPHLPKPRRARPRGSALILVMMILTVMALLGAAALTLSQQEAAVVNRGINYESLQSCADAAEKKLWAEYTKASASGVAPGPSVSVAPTVIPGTNARVSIGHFDADTTATTTVAFDSSTLRKLTANAASGGLQENDMSNTFRSSFHGQPYQIVAHCTDARGRQYEVELVVRFGL